MQTNHVTAFSIDKSVDLIHPLSPVINQSPSASNHSQVLQFETRVFGFSYPVSTSTIFEFSATYFECILSPATVTLDSGFSVFSTTVTSNNDTISDGTQFCEYTVTAIAGDSVFTGISALYSLLVEHDETIAYESTSHPYHTITYSVPVLDGTSGLPTSISVNTILDISYDSQCTSPATMAILLMPTCHQQTVAPALATDTELHT